MAKVVSCPQLTSSCLLYLKTRRKFAVEEAECEGLFACFFETGLHSVALAGLEFTMYKPGWPHTYRDPPASTSPVLELKASATVPSL